MNRIHPTAFIGPGVEFGEGNVVGPLAVVLGPTMIGDGNYIAPGAVIGAPGEMRGGSHPASWDGELEGAGIRIGDNNVIREQVSIQAPAFGTTSIGSGCYLMTKCHVPHDAWLGDDVTVACSVLIGGHGRIGSGANLGLGAILHQELVVGAGAMIGMGAVVTRPVPPYAMAYGSPARLRGANRVGMQRRGIPVEIVDELDRAYRNGELSDGNVPHRVPSSLTGEFRWYDEQMGHG